MTSRRSKGIQNKGYDDIDINSSSDEETRNNTKTDRQISQEYHFVPTTERVAGWDVFKQNEHEILSASEKQTDFIERGAVCLKVTTALIVMMVVLACGVVAKGTLFFMVAQTAPIKNMTVCPAALGLPNITGVVYTSSYDTQTELGWLW